MELKYKNCAESGSIKYSLSWYSSDINEMLTNLCLQIMLFIIINNELHSYLFDDGQNKYWLFVIRNNKIKSCMML